MVLQDRLERLDLKERLVLKDLQEPLDLLVLMANQDL